MLRRTLRFLFSAFLFLGVLLFADPFSAQAAPRTKAKKEAVPAFQVLTAVKTEEGKFYDAQGKIIKNSWVIYQNKYYFPDAQGSPYRNRFISFGPQFSFYLDGKGTRVHGLYSVKGQPYLLDPETGLLRKDNAWVTYEGQAYFPNAQGKLYHNQFIRFGSQQYYMGKTGARLTGLVRYQGKLYLCDERISGRVRKDNGWVTYQGQSYFPNAQGILYRNQMIHFGPKISYYMGKDGYKLSGILSLDNDLYLFDENRGGRLRKDNAWVNYGGGKVFPNAWGVLYRNQLIHFGPVSYYMNAKGFLETQRREISTKEGLLYLKPNGQVEKRYQEGISEVKGQLRYYDSKHGKFQDHAGWIHFQGKSYFANEQGILYRNRMITFGSQLAYYMGADGSTQAGIIEIGGKRYFFDPANQNRRRNTPGLFTYRQKEYLIDADGSLSEGEHRTIDEVPVHTGPKGNVQRDHQVLVIDLSYYQDPRFIDYDAIASQVSGVILRIGYTGSATGCSYYKDTAFERHFREFEKRGVPIGIYWYSCASTPQQGKAEAQTALQFLGDRKLSLPFYWDTEDGYHQARVSRSRLTDTGRAFLDTVKEAGYRPGIYASAFWFRDRLDMSRLSDYEVWVAHYGVKKPKYNGPYQLWQFTSSYRLRGFSGGLDASWMYVDYPSVLR